MQSGNCRVVSPRPLAGVNRHSKATQRTPVPNSSEIESAMRQINILITSAGRRVELARCFREDGRQLGLDVKIVAVDSIPAWSAACRDADASHKVPPCLEPDYIDSLLQICQDDDIDFIIPTIDTELMAISENVHRFSEVGAYPIISSPNVIALARDKLETMRACLRHGIPVPKTVMPGNFSGPPEEWNWPIIIKPRDGSCSAGIRIINNPLEFSKAELLPQDLIQEFISGPEFTINVFIDRSGQLICSIPHRRIEVRAGEVSKGRTERCEMLEKLAADVVSILDGAQGPLCLQAIIDEEDGTARLTEVNARFGGGFPLAHRAGAAFTRWLLEEAAGLPFTGNNQWRSGVVMLRYDAAIFVEENIGQGDPREK